MACKQCFGSRQFCIGSGSGSCLNLTFYRKISEFYKDFLIILVDGLLYKDPDPVFFSGSRSGLPKIPGSSGSGSATLPVSIQEPHKNMFRPQQLNPKLNPTGQTLEALNQKSQRQHLPSPQLNLNLSPRKRRRAFQSISLKIFSTRRRRRKNQWRG